MEIGTPFGTIEFGGIECGHGIGFGSENGVSSGAQYEIETSTTLE
jgi:hypothetical protein